MYSKILGGNGLKGKISISGSKNACLPIIAATLLTSETCILRNVPILTDTLHLLEIIRSLGVDVLRLEEHSWSITAKDVSTHVAQKSAGQLRASVCLMGALLGRKRQAVVAMPGGCNLGTRPIDLHLHAFASLGTTTKITNDHVYLSANNLTGTAFSMEGPHGPTVTGTSNAIMAAVCARGTTVIQRAATEPEVEDLCYFLTRMGAKIHGIGTSILTIKGIDKLHGTEFTIQPDRIEAGTLIILGLLCGHSIELINAPKSFLQTALRGFFAVHKDFKRYFHWNGDTLLVSQAHNLSPFNISAMPHPGFPTDLQPQITVLASQIAGKSRIRDTVFPKRFMHIPMLKRFGMNIEQSNDMAYVYGKTELQGTRVTAMDLRAGAALYIAGLVANGETLIFGLEHIDRGYEHFEARLRAIGATIERFSI
ncbi:MAG: UDP-N-acetylglucosamine 1-carboxyvinyltransferase [Puniceicoccales bacterium]|jgi:UDP-N-acetylglucosamine 1-carboxyvinyltransferase|nr:UDP-N-acetylglucosamine 1-carboxyvinyltransferase [Puniceicoccales bacterium]